MINVETATGYNSWVIKEIEVPMIKALGELRPSIEAERHGLIIGDDISGRVPTLAVREYASLVLVPKGKLAPPTVFLQDKTAVNVESLETQLQKRVLPFTSKGSFEKALYVTEYVQRGRKLERIMNLFKKYNIPFDLLVLYANPFLHNGTTSTALDFLEIPSSTTVVIGEKMGKPWLHDTTLAGLSIDYVGNKGKIKEFKKLPPVSEWRHTLRVYDGEYGTEHRGSVIDARADVHTLVQRAIDLSS